MQRPEFADHRVLVVGEKTHGIQLLRAVLGIAGVGRVIHVENSGRAIEMLGVEHFSAVFAGQQVAPVNGMPFEVAVRRTRGLRNPMIPLFVMADRAYRRDVELARDAGVTDVLTLPLSPHTILSKLHAATRAPRPFIVAQADRRSTQRPAYFGSERRRRTPRRHRVELTPV